MQENIKDSMESLGVSQSGNSNNIKLDLFSNASILNQSFENTDEDNQKNSISEEILDAKSRSSRDGVSEVFFE